MAVDRERFSPAELAVVLSHYDLGVIESAKEFPRGSSRSPKLRLRTADGRYLLKRRAQGRDKPARVTFAHTLLWHLRQKGFPVPQLLPTRDTGEWMLVYQAAEQLRLWSGTEAPIDEMAAAFEEAGRQPS